MKLTSAENLRLWSRQDLETLMQGIEVAWSRESENARKNDSGLYNRIEEELIRRDTPIQIGDIVTFIDEDAPAKRGHVTDILSNNEDYVYVEYHDGCWEDWHHKDELTVVGRLTPG